LKTFNILENIGKVRHVVSFHDGVKTHQDNSPFFEVRTFSRKQDVQMFARDLKAAGYVENAETITRKEPVMAKMKMTVAQEMSRLAQVQEWSPLLLGLLTASCARKGLTEKATLAVAQRAAGDSNLSALRGGDASLLRRYAEAFGLESYEALQEFQKQNRFIVGRTDGATLPTGAQRRGFGSEDGASQFIGDEIEKLDPQGVLNGDYYLDDVLAESATAWDAFANSGMRHMKDSDISGGEIDTMVKPKRSPSPGM